ncbi:hypothetical protein TNIN_85881 [Trichonephila inaurata madagascariensis]|uniref:Uncharacterized protein n=1 Tax=Trichonephila inaurata madagascariensis TaxID=2747483 RepID=A0A8X6KKY6_9ARAC|nr:hypothetical protein TNIN_85881 [Trichonephila inaurata madagascariensis]
MNERIALKEEMRLKKERWLVEEQMRHAQKKLKMSMKTEEQECLPEERCKGMNEQNQLLSKEQEKSDEDMELPQAIEKVLVLKSEQVQMLCADPDDDETYEEKEETPVDARKDKAKGDINPVSKEQVDSNDDEIEEEKPKFPKSF